MRKTEIEKVEGALGETQTKILKEKSRTAEFEALSMTLVPSQNKGFAWAVTTNGFRSGEALPSQV